MELLLKKHSQESKRATSSSLKTMIVIQMKMRGLMKEAEEVSSQQEVLVEEEVKER